MKEEIDWKALAVELGALDEKGESGSNRYAREAIELLLGEDNLRKAVDYYISGEPGSELARSILWQIRPWSAMKYCYDTYKSEKDVETKRLAIELLRVVADERASDWVEEFLEDEDADIQMWGAGVLDQLMHSYLVEAADVEHLLLKMEAHFNIHVREKAKSIRELIKREEVLDKAIKAINDKGDT